MQHGELTLCCPDPEVRIYGFRNSRFGYSFPYKYVEIYEDERIFWRFIVATGIQRYVECMLFQRIVSSNMVVMGSRIYIQRVHKRYNEPRSSM